MFFVKKIEQYLNSRKTEFGKISFDQKLKKKRCNFSEEISFDQKLVLTKN